MIEVIIMAHYTITIKTLKENNFDFGLQNYPIFNETYRNILNNNILNYYFENEIGFETAELFKRYLNNTMQLIMPKYNEMYKAQEKTLENIFGNVDLYETSNRKNQNKINTTTNSNSDNKNLFQDTPQGQISQTDIDNQQWATNVNLNKNNVDDESSSTGSGTNQYLKTIIGSNGSKYGNEILKDVYNNFLNIDLMIINELSDLFMQIY